MTLARVFNAVLPSSALIALVTAIGGLLIGAPFITAPPYAVAWSAAGLGAFLALLPGLETDAQRAIQFTRSTPGIAVALVGMGQAKHVEENLGVARARPATLAEYQRLYQ